MPREYICRGLQRASAQGSDHMLLAKPAEGGPSDTGPRAHLQLQGHSRVTPACPMAAGETCLALPKLNLQFLTITDYLLRNFHLFRLEATYEIREDIADVLPRFQVSLCAPAPAVGLWHRCLPRCLLKFN